MSGRTYLRSQVVKSDAFLFVVSQIQGVMKDKFDMCLIGGLAIGWHSNPPETVDADFLVAASMEELEPATWHFESLGWERGVLRFAHNRPGFPTRGVEIHAVSPISDSQEFKIQDIDLIAAGGDQYLQSVVSRAKSVSIEKGRKKVSFKVATPEDLVVIKTLVGRDKDVEDVMELQRKLGSALDAGYVDQKLNELL